MKPCNVYIYKMPKQSVGWVQGVQNNCYWLFYMKYICAYKAYILIIFDIDIGYN